MIFKIEINFWLERFYKVKDKYISLSRKEVILKGATVINVNSFFRKSICWFLVCFCPKWLYVYFKEFNSTFLLNDNFDTHYTILLFGLTLVDFSIFLTLYSAKATVDPASPPSPRDFWRHIFLESWDLVVIESGCRHSKMLLLHRGHCDVIMTSIGVFSYATLSRWKTTNIYIWGCWFHFSWSRDRILWLKGGKSAIMVS